jgi:segregation and condensation protein B
MLRTMTDSRPDDPEPPQIAPALLRSVSGLAAPGIAVPAEAQGDSGTGVAADAAVAAAPIEPEPPTAEQPGAGTAPPRASPDAPAPDVVEPVTVEVAPADAPAEPQDPEIPGASVVSRVEALLFAATEPLPLRRMKEVLAIEDGRLVREALDALTARYASSGAAVAIEEVAGGFQLRTRAEFAPLVARLGRRPQTEKLSPAALETLAIVAYRQPVLRADVERIRGVASGEVLRTLVERELVRVAGRAELPGSPLYYGTTTRFLEVFGLRDLMELPREGESLRPPPQSA